MICNKLLLLSDAGVKVSFPRWGNCSALRAPQFVPGPPVHFSGPCFNSGLWNYQWLTECQWFHVYFQFCKISYKHSTFCDRKNVKFEWLIAHRITINSKGCWAQERRFRLWNTITLQSERSTLKFPGPGTAFRFTLTPVWCAFIKHCWPAHCYVLATAADTVVFSKEPLCESRVFTVVSAEARWCSMRLSRSFTVPLRQQHLLWRRLSVTRVVIISLSLKERKKKRNTEMWQVTYLPRPPTLRYPHQSCHVGWGPRLSQPCQV